MAVKELALITEKKKRKKKESVQAAPTKPIKETISNNKGTTKINRSTISTKPSAQKTPQNRVVTNKERLTSKPTISDIRTVKTSNFKPKSIQTVDLYERGGRYFYKDGKKEKEVDQKFVQNALKNNKSGVIGRYNSKGKLKETDSQGNVKTAKAIRREKYKHLDEQVGALTSNLKNGKRNFSQVVTDIANVADAATDFGPGKVYKNALKTGANALDRVWTGSTKTIENIFDTANDWTTEIDAAQKYLINRARGMSKKEAEKERNAQRQANAEWVSRDLVKDFKDKTGYNEIQPSLEDGSLVKKDNFAGQVLEGVGGMLPALAVGQNATLGLTTKSTEGLAGLQKAKTVIGNLGRGFANQAGANTVLGASSYGSGIEEAYRNGATGSQARLYGLGNAATELATEWLSGGIPGTKSEGVIDNIVGDLISKKTAKVSNKYVGNILNAVIKSQVKGIGEGLEEGIAEIINPYLKNLTYSNGEKVDWKNVKDSALVGYAIGMFLNSPESVNEVKQGIKDAKISTERKTALLNELNALVESNDVGETAQEQRAQANEIAQRVQNGEIDEITGNALLEQVRNGTYAENRKIETQNNNLDTIAIRQKEQLDTQLEQGLITDEQYNQELRDIANATKQTREEINKPQQVKEQTQQNVEAKPKNVKLNKQKLIDDFKKLTGDSKMVADAKIGRYQVQLMQKEAGNFDGEVEKPYSNEAMELYNQIENSKKTSSHLYHSTPSDRIQSIVENGLKIGSKQNQEGVSSENKLYLSATEELAKSFTPNDEVTLRIKPSTNLENLDYDLLGGEGAYTITNNIEPKYLQVKENGKWVDLLKSKYAKENNNIPTTKSENVISEEVKSQETQKQETTNEGPEILDKMPTEKKSTIKSLKKGIDTFRKEITDAFAPVYDMARKTRNMTLYHKADKILGSDGMAQVDLGRNQVDLKGKPFKNFTNYEEINKLNKQIEDTQKNKSISETDKEKQINELKKKIESNKNIDMSFEKAYDSYSKIPNKAKNEFLVHQLNIDRLNQGVDQFDIPLQESQQRVEELRKQYEDIDKWSENTYQFYRNLIQNMVDNGRIPQSLADKWLKETPHFIHIERQVPNKGNQGVSVRNGKVDSDNLIRKIKGGNYAILPIKESTANYVQNARRAFAFNDFGKEYARTIGTDARGENVSADTDIDEIFGFEPEFVNSDGSGNYTLKIYEDGTPVEIPISEDVYNSLSPKTIPRVGVLAEATKVYKDLLTNKNPFFGFLRNPIKDAGDMFLYSKHPLYKSLKTYTKLFVGRTALRNRKITKDGVTAQDIVDFYYNTGNAVHSFYKNGQFESNKGNAKKGIDKVLSPIEKGNDFMESMPRITEFWNTIESEGYTIKDGELVPQKGKTPKKTIEQVIAEANYNAADVTVNFKRGGRTSKAISRNGGIFFNPSAQGASKFTRNITEAVGDAKAGDFQAAKRLILRAAGMGVAPAILSAIMYGDDDEYKELQDYQKDQYYLIKAGDGKWIRIPKGRAISLFESATRRALDKGKGGKFDAKEYGKLALNQIAPSNPLDNNLFSPVFQAAANKSWSKNKIVSDSMAKRPVEEQFNEKTDELSKKLGKQLHISPMKINYVINQYSGVLGDLVLPQITPKASTGSSNPVMNILRDNYSFDAANSSKNVGDFYDVKGKLNTKASGLNPSSKDKLESQYMNKQAQKMYALYDKKQKIQMDKNLSKKEKYQQALEVQKEINKFAKKATENVKKVDIKKNTATIGDDLYYKNKNSNSGWSQENEKTTQKREALGLSPEKYYYYKNDESYKTSDGYTKSITSGKNAKQTIAMVEAFNFDPSDYLEYKSKLSKIRGDKGANGKTIRYSARKKKIAYLNTLPISSVEKAYLMKQSDRYYRSSDNSLKKAIKSSSMSDEDKKQIYSYLRLGR